MKTKKITKIDALAMHLGVDKNDINIDGDDVFLASRGKTQRWMVLTDDDADATVREQILNSLWAFNAEFIAAHTRDGLSPGAITALKEMQGMACEDANDIVGAMIVDMDRFVRDAVMTDGRGHFISDYDGAEVELDGGFFGYRLG